ncbi:MAG: hypothetical protein WKF40_11985 [Thermoleophilaceae bacterium]
MRIWDPGSGAVERVLEGHTGRVNAVCAVRVDGRELLASAAADHTVRIWDPGSGAVERVLEGHTDWVNAVCAVRVDGRDLLASAAADRTVRIWDPSMTMAQHITLIPTPAPALAVAQFGAGSLFVGVATGVIAVRIHRPERAQNLR